MRADGSYEDAITGADGTTSIVARSSKAENLQIVLADNEAWEVEDPDVAVMPADEACCGAEEPHAEETQG
ncbi:hypothetical protein [Stenotrophomonas humi]